jgi:superfamily II DNA or RNA helicase
MTIDDIADRSRHQLSPGETFRQNWLTDLPTEQWATYIDDSAELIFDGIAIGETDLTKGDYPAETGPFYQRSLAASADVELGETSLPVGNINGRQLGIVAWVCNQLQREIREGDSAIRSPSRAIEAAVNKALLESAEEGDIAATHLDTIRLPSDASVSEILSEIFCRPRSQDYVEALIEIAVETNHSDRSLLQLVEEPRMTTQLWRHQQQALSAWIDAGYRGYVDMATATGKTVLGLAAIAHHYGALHPADQADLGTTAAARASGDRATVLVVAHRDIILNQWKREFDKHLNIPEEGETDRGEHTVTFSWGDVHFWTPSRLIERGVPDADLVILDETHHYVGSSGFGSVLDDIDCDILALSGSLDDADARSLKRRDIERLYHFTLKDGQRVGIIPECSWDVSIVPYESQSTLARVTQQCRSGMQEFADGPSDSVLEDLGVERSDLSFDSFSEAQSVVRSTAGREFAKKSDTFREFSSAVKSRRLTQSNQSPALSRITELTAEHVHEHKCVVLLESNDEIQTVNDGLERQLGDAATDLLTIVSSDTDDPLHLVEEFDQNAEHGAIIGTSQTLGEGVDIKTADIGINRGRGRLTHSLVQRMGRILRNPEGDKEAHFYHVHGIPTEDEAILPREDGIWLLETASQLLAWGKSFNAPPVFDAPDDRVPPVLTRLETAGTDGVASEAYEWPEHEAVRTELETLTARIRDGESQPVLLALERQQMDDGDAGTDTSDTEQEDGSLSLIAGATGQTVPVVEPFAAAAEALEESVRPGDTFVDRAVRTALRDTRDELFRGTVDESELDGATETVQVSPSLTALVAEQTARGDANTDVFVNDAIALAIAEYVADTDLTNGTDYEEIVSKLADTVQRGDICKAVVRGDEK